VASLAGGLTGAGAGTKVSRVTGSPGSGVFVGRGNEEKLLRELVAAVAQGRGAVAWVEGEPGIGKSALLAAGLAGAAALGCTVFAGAADPLRAPFPLGVMLDSLGMDARPVADGAPTEIAALLWGNDAQGRLPADGRIPSDGAAAAAERIVAWVHRLCTVSPVVLVIDDLQWADELSVSVWYRLAAATAQVPLLVVGASRPVPRSAAVVAARQGVARMGGVVVALEPLPDADVTALVAGLVGEQPGHGLLRQARRASGNPLYVRELVDALMREDRVRVGGGLAEVVGAGAVPASLAAAIEGRLGFLSEQALAVLRVAALLGPRFSVRELAVVAGVRGPELARVVGEAVAAGVLVESGLELVFRHGLIQEALADGMPAGLRAALRWEAARTLAEAGAGPDRVVGQLLGAGQLLEAGTGGELDAWVVEWLACHAALLVHRAPHTAAELLDQAVGGVAAGDPHWEMLAEHLAGALFLLARNEQAESAARSVLAKASDPQRRARMGWTLAYTLLRTQRPGEALAPVSEALGAVDVPEVWRARLRSLSALVLMIESRYGDAAAEAAAALADAEEAGDRFAGGWALHVQSFGFQMSSGDYAAAQEMNERALTTIGDDLETTDLRLLLMTRRLLLLWPDGNGLTPGRDVIAEARELLTLADRVGTARSATARAAAASMLFETGAWDDVLAELDALFEPGADVLDYAVVGGHGLAALIAVHRGDRAAAAAHLSAAEELPGRAGRTRDDLDYYVELLRARAVLAEQDGRPEDAMVCMNEAVAAANLHSPVELTWLPELVRSAISAGDRAAAEAVAVRSQEDAARCGEASAPLAAVTARWCRGLADADPVALAEAVAFYRAFGLPLALGQALEDLAVARAAGDDSAGAREALLEAVQVYGALGAEWDITRADARVRPYGVRRRRMGTRRPETGWEALTPTETKVAFLVSEGLSNPDIGKRLFLSRHTVESHVRKVLAKLQVRSRVEVATAAMARRPPRSG
jgi:DNA-binding CsgD family transcriptional regulator/tetratricopeptide (TPR) repeat protein